MKNSHQDDAHAQEPTKKDLTANDEITQRAARPRAQRNERPTPPERPSSRIAWPSPHGDLSHGAANDLVHYLNALSDYASHLARWERNERLRTIHEVDCLTTLYESALRRYQSQNGSPKTQAVELAAGRIALEEWTEQLVIEDEAAALAWCYRHANSAVDVTISLNGTFDSILTRFMQRELPAHLHHSPVFSRTVNIDRLQEDWKETELDVPDGCSLLEAETRVVISLPSRRRPQPSKQEVLQELLPEEGERDDQ